MEGRSKAAIAGRSRRGRIHVVELREGEGGPGTCSGGLTMVRRGFSDDHASVKHREVVYQRWVSAILRETRDHTSLSQVESRAMNDPDVRSDDLLANMIRSYVAERHVELRQRQWQKAMEEAKREGKLEAAQLPVEPPSTSSAGIYSVVRRLGVEFGQRAGDLDEAAAQGVLIRLRDLHGEHPQAFESQPLAEYEAALKRLTERIRRIEDQIEQVAGHAISSAAKGDTDAMATALQRLASVRSAHPRLLSEERLAEIRDAVLNAGEEHEHRLAAKALIERERAVAVELKALSERIHRFHRLANETPHNAQAYRKAEMDYVQAVKDVRTHDTEWLAGFILELADLLEEWGDPPPEAQTQLDRFLHSVRSSLTHLRSEIREIEQEHHPDKPG